MRIILVRLLNSLYKIHVLWLTRKMDRSSYDFFPKLIPWYHSMGPLLIQKPYKHIIIPLQATTLVQSPLKKVRACVWDPLEIPEPKYCQYSP